MMGMTCGMPNRGRPEGEIWTVRACVFFIYTGLFLFFRFKASTTSAIMIYFVLEFALELFFAVISDN